MKYTAVVLGAGSGSRMGLGYNKVLYNLNERTVIENTLDIFIDDHDCVQIILVIGDLEVDSFLELGLHHKVELTIGGRERQDSVLNGLRRVSSEYVMIHDGARPYLDTNSLARLKKALEDVDSCLLAVPTTDTIKVVSEGIVIDTPKRETLYNAQTPQAFKTSVVLNSYLKIAEDQLSVTDDTQAVEMVTGIQAKIVKGNYENIKLTTVQDIK